MIDGKEFFLISVEEKDYLYNAFVNSVRSRFPKVEILQDLNLLKNKDKECKILHYGDYEDMDIDILVEDKKYLFSSYIYRKSLIRKHYLLNTIQHYTCKNPDSILNQLYLETFRFEIDYAEFLDDYLDEFYELRDEILKEEKIWILKPSMSDKGQGIRIFKTMEELQAIFDDFDDDSEEEEENEQAVTAEDTRVITSQLRHFIVQEYMTNPLLLNAYNNRKFHIRTYVMCKGDIDVFVYQRMLALFSEVEYDKIDGETFDFEKLNLNEHLTNTCLQKGDQLQGGKDVVVAEFCKLEGVLETVKAIILKQINENVKELFKAAINVDRMNFQPLENAFEFYGLDFLVDDQYKVKVLEVNAYPDFKQSGDSLRDLVSEFIDSSVTAVGTQFYSSENHSPVEHNVYGNLINVLSIK